MQTAQVIYRWGFFVAFSLNGNFGNNGKVFQDHT